MDQLIFYFFFFFNEIIQYLIVYTYFLNNLNKIFRVKFLIYFLIFDYIYSIQLKVSYIGWEFYSKTFKRHSFWNMFPDGATGTVHQRLMSWCPAHSASTRSNSDITIWMISVLSSSGVPANTIWKQLFSGRKE